MRNNINKKKKKISSSFSLTNCLSRNYYMIIKFINLSEKECCGRAEIRTRDFCVTSKCFTAKLLAHSNNINKHSYLNLF
jgi:hypothetical protein